MLSLFPVNHVWLRVLVIHIEFELPPFENYGGCWCCHPCCHVERGIGGTVGLQTRPYIFRCLTRLGEVMKLKKQSLKQFQLLFILFMVSDCQHYNSLVSRSHMVPVTTFSTLWPVLHVSFFWFRIKILSVVVFYWNMLLWGVTRISKLLLWVVVQNLSAFPRYLICFNGTALSNNLCYVTLIFISLHSTFHIN